MALTNCKDCGTQHSTNASACPKCGRRYGRRSLQQIKVGCMAMAVFIGLMWVLSVLFS